VRISVYIQTINRSIDIERKRGGGKNHGKLMVLQQKCAKVLILEKHVKHLAIGCTNALKK